MKEKVTYLDKDSMFSVHWGTIHEKAQSGFCSNFSDRSLSANHRSNMELMACWPIFPEGSIPSRKAKCPQCGQRVRLRITFCHDGCCVYYAMPRHKLRKQKPKKQSRDNKTKRISKR